MVQPEPRGRGGVSPAAVRGCGRGAVPREPVGRRGRGVEAGVGAAAAAPGAHVLTTHKIKKSWRTLGRFLGKGFCAC